MPLTLRPYQRESLDEHYEFFERHQEPDAHPLFVVPTGGGKSLIMAEFIRESLRRFPKNRFLVLTHVRELIRQNYEEFLGQWDSPLNSIAGVYSAGMKRRDLGSPVLFAGIQSVYNRVEELGPYHLVLVDEAHLVPKRGQGRYLTFLDAMRELNPKVRRVGYTATHYRMNGGYLHRGDDRIFTHVAHEVRLEDLVPDHLCELVVKQPKESFDVRGVAISAGDFNRKQLESKIMPKTIAATYEAVSIARDHDRRHWLAFACTRKHALQIRATMMDCDVDAEVVFGNTPKVERDYLTDKFRAGELTCLVNVGVLTTGFNSPLIDLLIVMRPTQSPGLYVQIMGRGMRNSPGKKNCIAEGQRVLTDRGLVPIEQVRGDDLLWDGVEFISHDGVMCMGPQRVIYYDGLWATPDHEVVTDYGWKTLGECRSLQIQVQRARWSLRAGESSMDYEVTAAAQHEEAIATVYDVLNAGPRHRFVVEGLIVSNCLVLDYGSNVLRHGPINKIRPRSKRASVAEPSVRVCPECGTISLVGVLACPGIPPIPCGYVWPTFEIRPNHQAEASTLAVMDFDGDGKRISLPMPKEHRVDSMEVSIHRKPFQPNSMLVVYWCGRRRIREWVHFERDGNMRKKAEKWWRKHAGDAPYPKTVEEAVAAIELSTNVLADPNSEFKTPDVIRVVKNARGFEEIIAHLYAEGSREKLA